MEWKRKRKTRDVHRHFRIENGRISQLDNSPMDSRSVMMSSSRLVLTSMSLMSSMSSMSSMMSMMSTMWMSSMPDWDARLRNFHYSSRQDEEDDDDDDSTTLNYDSTESFRLITCNACN